MKPHSLPPRSPDGNVYVFVEIPKDGRSKYEYDKELGVLKLDRALFAAVHYPTDYGFVPSTRSQDDELLDALVMVDEPSIPGCLIEGRLLGMLTIYHHSGKPEYKMLVVPIGQPRFEQYRDISDIPAHILAEISNFFDVFKELEGKDLSVGDWEGAERANEALDEAIRAAELQPAH